MSAEQLRKDEIRSAITTAINGLEYAKLIAGKQDQWGDSDTELLIETEIQRLRDCLHLI